MQRSCLSLAKKVSIRWRALYKCRLWSRGSVRVLRGGTTTALPALSNGNCPHSGRTNNSARCLSRSAFHTMTLTTPVSSSSVTKTAPLAVLGCWRVATMRQRCERTMWKVTPSAFVVTEVSIVVETPGMVAVQKQGLTLCIQLRVDDAAASRVSGRDARRRLRERRQLLSSISTGQSHADDSPCRTTASRCNLPHNG